MIIEIGLLGIGFLFGIKVMLNREKKQLQKDLKTYSTIKMDIRNNINYNQAVARMAAYEKNLRN